MKIKQIYFDIGGVLFTFRSGLEKLEIMTGLPYAECEKIWRELDDAVCRGALAPQEIWNTIKKKSGYSGADIDFVDFWVNQFEPIVATHEFVKKIEKNYQIGLLSNIYHGAFPLAVQRGKVPNISYKPIILSSEIGFVKPNPEIYEIAEKQANLSPDEILYIDDLQNYILPAEQRGWNTFLFDTKNPTSSVSKLQTLFNLDIL